MNEQVPTSQRLRHLHFDTFFNRLGIQEGRQKMNTTLKTLALAGIITIVSCSSSQKTKMVGAFGESTNLTAEEDSLFNAVVLVHDDLQLKPLKVSRQVVAGTNYRYANRS